MSEPELVFESDLEGWIRFKYSDLRGKMFPEKKEEFLCTAWFYGYYVSAPYKTLGSFGAKSDTDL